MPHSRIIGFAPVDNARARVLILGSMPGVASLSAGRYYAHPRNAFWPIMGALLGTPPDASYDRRTRDLKSAGIALWDVVQSCRRSGSLDTAIHRASVRVNDFGRFFAAHPRIALICFNGGAAERLYEALVAGRPPVPDLPRLRLPSTSPAHAGRSFAAKLAAWHAALGEAPAAQAAESASAWPRSSTASTSSRRSSSRVR